MVGQTETARLPYVRRVKRAYEQVAHQMRQWILSGALDVGDPLPSESELARQFEASRSTIREALRLLSSENLILTRPGARGGSVVSSPDAGWIAGSLHTSLSLLVRTNDLTVQELFAAREFIEVPAAGLAATNRTEGQLATLAALLPTHPDNLSAEELFECSLAFHTTLLEASGNRLLPLLVSPAYQLTARRFTGECEPNFPPHTMEHHARLYEVVRAGDACAASSVMAEHLHESQQVLSGWETHQTQTSTAVDR